MSITDIYVTTKIASEEYHVTRRTILHWCNKGLTFEDLDGRKVFKRADIENFVRKKGQYKTDFTCDSCGYVLAAHQICPKCFMGRLK